MSTTIPKFGTPVLGETEKALNAILVRQLSGTGLTEPQWVTLSVTAVSGGSATRAQLAGRLAGALKVGDEQANARIDELTAAGLVAAAGGDESPVELTDAGRRLHGEVRAGVIPITERLWGDLPAEDLDTASRVLSTILARANAELAAG
jgi:DNA-binding MarR family transcriptional regulator